jgi:A/G-specific adenine glycosylase
VSIEPKTSSGGEQHPGEFSALILNWYTRQGRKLPWRGSLNPYAVWVSEIMLQQTRVETVIPYFERWMERFPSIAALAAASEQEVLSVWEGLGYYSRARNLYKAARIVMQEYAGNLPADLQALRKLPGIGRYTVGAIASMEILEGFLRVFSMWPSRPIPLLVKSTCGSWRKLISRMAGPGTTTRP